MLGLSTAAIIACFVVSSVTATAKAQSKQLYVDALTQCFEIDTYTIFGFADTSLLNGYYRISMSSNAQYASGDPNSSVDKVAFFITTFGQPNGWFFTLEEGGIQYLTVSGPNNPGDTSNTIRAFFLDSGCRDNSGGASIIFNQLK